jgi:hypothetical protein
MSLSHHLKEASLLIYCSYFIGRFGKAGKPKHPVKVGAEWIATFELAKPHPLHRWEDDDWDGNTSRWEW